MAYLIFMFLATIASWFFAAGLNFDLAAAIGFGVMAAMFFLLLADIASNVEELANHFRDH